MEDFECRARRVAGAEAERARYDGMDHGHSREPTYGKELISPKTSCVVLRYLLGLTSIHIPYILSCTADGAVFHRLA